MIITFYHYLLIGLIILTVLYGTYQYQKYQLLKLEQEETFGKKRISLPFNKKIQRHLQKGYNLIARIPILRTILFRIRKRLETLAVYDEYTLRSEVMKIFASIIALFVFITMILAVIRPSWLLTFWIFVGLLLLSGILIDFFVLRVEIKLLKQLNQFVNRIRFYYQNTKIVDEAVYQSIPFAGPEMKAHAERLYKIINNLETEKELAKYEDVAPNKYLRILAGLLVLVKEHGDKFDKVNGKSAFLSGLTDINKEISAELLYRLRLSLALKGVAIITVAPIFFAHPIMLWSVYYFPTTELFYTSRIGFTSEVFVYALSIGCYLYARKMREINDYISELKPQKKKFGKWLMEKIPFLKTFCSLLSPRPYSKKYYKQKELIKDTNENMTVEELTLQRIVTVLIVFFVMLSLVTVAHLRESYGILNQTASQSMFLSQLSEKEQQELLIRNEFDKQIIADLKGIDVPPTEEIIKTWIADQMNVEVDNPKVETAYQRISYKWEVISNAYVKWWEVLIVIVLSYLSSYIPILILMRKRKERLKKMEQEVYQLLVLIGMLKEFDGMDTYTILNWLNRFSIMFKKSLTIAIHEYYAGPETALEKLANSNSFEPFQQIVERLKLSVVKLSIPQAFEDIEVNKEYYLEERKVEQQRIVENKQRLGFFIGIIPLSSLIFIYLIFPLMYIAAKEVKNITTLLYIN